MSSGPVGFPRVTRWQPKAIGGASMSASRRVFEDRDRQVMAGKRLCASADSIRVWIPSRKRNRKLKAPNQRSQTWIPALPILLASHGTRESLWAKRPHSTSRRYGRFAYDSKSPIGAEISRSSIWLSIANFEPATLCNCVYATSAMVRSWRPEPSSCSKKPADLSSLRSLNRHARRYQLGLPVRN
jgi:hypothetical protein